MKKILSSLLFLILIISFTNAQSGCISGDCEDGYGVYVWDDGERYEGEWKNGKKHGFGTYFYNKQSIYSGTWKNGQKYYFGTYYWPDGDFFMGLYKDGKSKDQGVYVYDTGKPKYKYEGVIFDEKGCVLGDCNNGYGVYIWENGDMYSGFWENDKKEYWGAYFWKDDFFIGRYKQGKSTDHGIYFKSDGEPKIKVDSETPNKTGSVAGNCKNGFGVYVWESGNIYAGMWKNDEQHGFGSKYWLDGDFYMGLYNDGNRQDRGIYVWDDGDYKFENEEYYFYDYNDYSEPETDNYDQTPEEFAKIKVWAVVVGVADYNHIKSLSYTDDDAYKFAMFLKSPEGGALPDDQITVLIDEDATKKNILKAMDNLYQKADENDVIIFYFSGHGSDDSFLAHDYNSGSGKIFHSVVRDKLNNSKAKNKICLADACHSGGMEENYRTSEAVNTINNYYDAWKTSKGGIALMMSSKVEETSIEFRGIRQGVFSYYLIKGLKGEADKNNNLVITIRELYYYIEKNVKDYTNNRQNPILFGEFDNNMPVGVKRD